ncbi:MAG TPA: DUF4129 domain-containing protein [Microbacterium sp.]|nr:DUF4129 domain-containing protein [Microbacterium sp.]
MVLRFRAAARGLDERGLIELAPGTTARQFAVRADALAAPVSAGAREAATVFEDVRYLQRPGTETGYVVVAAADSALARLESAQGAPAEVPAS